MNRLSGLRVYLCGGMDRVLDAGVEWRRQLTPFLQNLNLHIFDPTNKPIHIGVENLEDRQLRAQLKHDSQFEELSQRVRTISNVDLRMVDICDFLIVHMDLEIYPVGTIWEIVIANLQKKPILLHMEQGINQVPDWLFGRLPYQEFFSTWAELKDYLHKIAFTSFDPGKRWYFFDKDNL